MKSRLLILLTMVVLFGIVVSAVAAQDSGSDSSAGDHAGMDMSSMDSPVSGLPTVGPNVTIRFAATVGSRPATCGMVYEDVGTTGATLSVNDFRFYVSNVRLINAMGEAVPVELTQDGMWQYSNVALLDFEDGTSLCSDAGNPELNDKVIGTVPAGEYTGLAFDLGVPFELDHLDTTTAPTPLNIPALWWNWQVGYKFVRIDLQTPNSETPAWFVHLGSTGCASADGNTPPTEPCSNPNVATVRFDSFNPVQNFVVADLAGLMAGVDLSKSAPMPPGCMSGPEDPDCTGLFPGFGLDLTTGAPVEGSVQTFFRVE